MAFDEANSPPRKSVPEKVEKKTNTHLKTTFSFEEKTSENEKEIIIAKSPLRESVSLKESMDLRASNVSNTSNAEGGQKNKFADIKNMLGNKMGFGPMPMMMGMPRKQDQSMGAEIKLDDHKEIIPIRESKMEKEERDYESIVNEKVNVVSKKKPKMRMFNSNINAITDKEAEKKSEVIREEKPFESRETINKANNETKTEPKIEVVKEEKQKKNLFEFEDNGKDEPVTARNTTNTKKSVTKKIDFLFD
jgi:hypothetical protein